MDDWQEAKRLFAEYIKQSEGDINGLLENFESDQRTLSLNGINEIDRCIMEDVMRQEANTATE